MFDSGLNRPAGEGFRSWRAGPLQAGTEDVRFGRIQLWPEDVRPVRSEKATVVRLGAP